MNLLEFVQYVIDALEREGVVYMLVGSIASTIYGEPRFTQDVDLVLQLEEAVVPSLCDAFAPPEFYVSEPALLDCARRGGQANVIHPSSGNKADLIPPPDNHWGKSQLGRRRDIEIAPGVHGFVASPEDVVLGKLWYHSLGGSEKHLRDVAGVIKSNADFDRAYVDSWVQRLSLEPSWQAATDRQG